VQFIFIYFSKRLPRGGALVNKRRTCLSFFSIICELLDSLPSIKSRRVDRNRNRSNGDLERKQNCSVDRYSSTLGGLVLLRLTGMDPLTLGYTALGVHGMLFLLGGIIFRSFNKKLWEIDDDGRVPSAINVVGFTLYMCPTFIFFCHIGCWWAVREEEMSAAYAMLLLPFVPVAFLLFSYFCLNRAEKLPNLRAAPTFVPVLERDGTLTDTEQMSNGFTQGSNNGTLTRSSAGGYRPPRYRNTQNQAQAPLPTMIGVAEESDDGSSAAGWGVPIKGEGGDGLPMRMQPRVTDFAYVPYARSRDYGLEEDFRLDALAGGELDDPFPSNEEEGDRYAFTHLENEDYYS
jgi:hypothetical protein